MTHEAKHLNLSESLDERQVKLPRGLVLLIKFALGLFVIDVWIGTIGAGLNLIRHAAYFEGFILLVGALTLSTWAIRGIRYKSPQQQP